MANPILVLSDITTDFDQFRSQIEDAVSNKPTWVGNLTTQTSQTLVELISTIGTFDGGRILSAFENAFSETAQSDDAIRSIAQMQGLRMSRKLPSGIEVTFSCSYEITIPPITQFLVAGSYYFSREQIYIPENVEVIATLFQGQLKSLTTTGLGTDNQTFVSEEDTFIVSDRDVQVRINGTIIPKAFGNLWNYRDMPGYSDLTTADGRLLLIFGSTIFGSIPGTNDIVEITYPLTDGASADNQTIVGKPVAADGFNDVVGIVNTNPSGGGDDKSILAYKNLASGSFGSYQSSVTKSQYDATVGVYPGIVDAFTQAQREINPRALEWMNVIRVSGLTLTPWTQQQKRDFCAYMQTVTMYAPYFIWTDAIAIPRDVELDVYCFNTAVLSEVQDLVNKAIVGLFNPRPGLLMTNFYDYDLMNVARASGNGSISYVVVQSPTAPMVITAPASPVAHYTIIPGGGTLTEYQYAYGISTINIKGEEGPPSNWVHPQVVGPSANAAIQLDWPIVPDTATYKIWGRKPGFLGLLTTISASSPLTWTDNGSVTPTGNPPNTLSEVPIRYNSLNSLTINMFFAERQQRLDTQPTRSRIS